jgi:hypothetical protein
MATNLRTFGRLTVLWNADEALYQIDDARDGIIYDTTSLTDALVHAAQWAADLDETAREIAEEDAWMAEHVL